MPYPIILVVHFFPSPSLISCLSRVVWLEPFAA